LSIKDLKEANQREVEVAQRNPQQPMGRWTPSGKLQLPGTAKERKNIILPGRKRGCRWGCQTAGKPIISG